MKNLIWIVVALLLPAVCMAGELKIYDSRGVLRSVKPIEKSAQVLIWTDPPQIAEGISLENESGLAADVIGEHDVNGAIKFRAVAEGSWRIIAKNGTIKIVKVEIQN